LEKDPICRKAIGQLFFRAPHAEKALGRGGADPVRAAGTLGPASPTAAAKTDSHFFEAAEARNGEIIAKIYGAE
jgi:hypothetical protein